MSNLNLESASTNDFQTQTIQDNISFNNANTDRDEINSNHCLGEEENWQTFTYSLTSMVIVISLTTVFCLFALVGNIIVMVALVRDRVIRKQKQTRFLLSLATADALLVILVVPFTLVNTLSSNWPFGSVFCRIYLSVDILLCTASICNICCIAIDRFISVKYPMFYRKHSSKTSRMHFAIACVWIYAIGVSSIPFLGTDILTGDGSKCFINKTPWYIILSSVLSFFLPALITAVVYTMIYTIAKRMEKAKRSRYLSKIKQEKTLHQRIYNLFRKRCKKFSQENIDDATQTIVCAQVDRRKDELTNHNFERSVQTFSTSNLQNFKSTISKPNPGHRCNNSCLTRRESRYIFIVSLITGCFILCWFPFFMTYFVYAVCESCCIPPLMFNVFFWTGYLNSAVNPVLYTVFNKDLRLAFQRLLRSSMA